MNRLGFRRALVVVVSVLLLLSLLITLVVSNQILKNTTSEDLKQTILNSATYESFRIAQHVEKSAKTVQGLADLYDKYNEQIALEDIIGIAAVAGNVHKVTVGFDDGRSYASKHDVNFPGGVGDMNRYDPRERPWFKLGRVSKELALSDVFFTTRDKEPMLGAVHPIENGTLLVDIRLNHMHKLLKEMKVVDGAVGIITDAEGTIMASTAEFAPVSEKITSLPAISSISQRLFTSDYTFQTIELDAKKSVFVSKRIDLVANAKWYLMIAVDMDTAFAKVESAAWKLNSLALIIATVSILVLLFVLSRLYKPVIKLKERVEKLSDGEGDLSSRLEVNSDDDLGDIARGINHFISNLQSMMLEVQSMTTKLSDGVDVLRTQENQSSVILSEHMSETEQVVTAMEELSCTSKLVSEHADHTVKYTTEANTVADSSKGTIMSAQNSLQTLIDEVELTTANVTSMSEETEGIASILSVIGGIADQTNLLALNAAIEAARAGEQGRGFAVVADEVRALAGKTQQSTSEIELALSALKGGASSVVVAIERTENTSKNAVSEAKAVANNLGDLTEYVAQINDLSMQISTSANEQNVVIQEINNNMSRIHNMVCISSNLN